MHDRISIEFVTNFLINLDWTRYNFIVELYPTELFIITLIL